MHGLIFETSIWQLAGSTRLIRLRDQLALKQLKGSTYCNDNKSKPERETSERRINICRYRFTKSTVLFSQFSEQPRETYSREA